MKKFFIFPLIFFSQLIYVIPALADRRADYVEICKGRVREQLDGKLVNDEKLGSFCNFEFSFREEAPRMFAAGNRQELIEYKNTYIGKARDEGLGLNLVELPAEVAWVVDSADSGNFYIAQKDGSERLVWTSEVNTEQIASAFTRPNQNYTDRVKIDFGNENIPVARQHVLGDREGARSPANLNAFLGGLRRFQVEQGRADNDQWIKGFLGKKDLDFGISHSYTKAELTRRLNAILIEENIQDQTRFNERAYEILRQTNRSKEAFEKSDAFQTNSNALNTLLNEKFGEGVVNDDMKNLMKARMLAWMQETEGKVEFDDATKGFKKRLTTEFSQIESLQSGNSKLFEGADLGKPENKAKFYVQAMTRRGGLLHGVDVSGFVGRVKIQSSSDGHVELTQHGKVTVALALTQARTRAQENFISGGVQNVASGRIEEAYRDMDQALTARLTALNAKIAKGEINEVELSNLESGDSETLKKYGLFVPQIKFQDRNTVFESKLSGLLRKGGEPASKASELVAALAALEIHPPESLSGDPEKLVRWARAKIANIQDSTKVGELNKLVAEAAAFQSGRVEGINELRREVIALTKPSDEGLINGYNVEGLQGWLAIPVSNRTPQEQKQVEVLQNKLGVLLQAQSARTVKINVLMTGFGMTVTPEDLTSAENLQGLTRKVSAAQGKAEEVLGKAEEVVETTETAGLSQKKIDLHIIRGQQQIQRERRKLALNFGEQAALGEDIYKQAEWEKDNTILAEYNGFLSEYRSHTRTLNPDQLKDARKELAAYAQTIRNEALEPGISDARKAYLEERASRFDGLANGLMDEPLVVEDDEVDRKKNEEETELAQVNGQVGELEEVIREADHPTEVASRHKKFLDEEERRNNPPSSEEQNEEEDLPYTCDVEGNIEGGWSSWFSEENVGTFLGLAGTVAFGVAQKRLYEKGSEDETFHGMRALALIGSTILNDGQPIDPAAAFVRQPIDAAIIPLPELHKAIVMGANPFNQGGFGYQQLSPEQRLALATQAQGAGMDITNPNVQNMLGLGYQGFQAPGNNPNALAFQAGAAVGGPSFAQYPGQYVGGAQARQSFGNFVGNIQNMGGSANQYNRQLAGNMPNNTTFAAAIQHAGRMRSLTASFDQTEDQINQAEQDVSQAAASSTTGRVAAPVMTNQIVDMNMAYAEIQEKIRLNYQELVRVFRQHAKAVRKLSVDGMGLMRGGYKGSVIDRNIDERNTTFFEMQRLFGEIDRLKYVASVMPSAPQFAQRLLQPGDISGANETFLATLVNGMVQVLVGRRAYAITEEETNKIFVEVKKYLERNDKKGLEKFLSRYYIVPNWKEKFKEMKEILKEGKKLTLHQLKYFEKQIIQELQKEPKGLYEMSYSVIKYEELNLKAIALQAEHNKILLNQMEAELKNKNLNPAQLKKAKEELEAFKKLVAQTKVEADKAALELKDMHDLQLKYAIRLKERDTLKRQAKELLGK